MKAKLFWFQRFLIALLIGFVLLLIYRHRAEFIEIIQAAGQSVWQALVFAGLIEMIFQINRAKTHSELYKFMGKKVKIKEIIPAHLMALSTNVALPSGGLAGFHLYKTRLSKYGIEDGRLLFANMFHNFVDYVFLGIYFILGMVLLSLGLGTRAKGAVGAELTMLALILVLAGAALLIISNARTIADWFHKLIAWLKGGQFKSILPSRVGIRSRVEHFISAGEEAFEKRQRLWPVILRVALNEPLRLIILWMSFFAIGYELPLGVLLICYTIGVISMGLSITPQGLGATEAVMTAVFMSFSVPTGVAALGVMLYRLITFWLPFLVGVLEFRKFRSLQTLG